MKKWMVIATLFTVPTAYSMNRIATTARQTAQKGGAVLRAALHNNPTMQTMRNRASQLADTIRPQMSDVGLQLRDFEAKLRNRDRRLYDEYIKQFRGNNRLRKLDNLNTPLTRAQKEVLFGLDTQMLKTLEKYLRLRDVVSKFEKMGNKYVPNPSQKNPINPQQQERLNNFLQKNQAKSNKEVAQWLKTKEFKNALINNYSLPLIQKLIDEGIDINKPVYINREGKNDRRFKDDLDFYQRYNDQDGINTLLNELEFIKSPRVDYFMTPVEIAITLNDHGLLALLLQNGANPNLVRNYPPETPLQRAIKINASPDIIITLLNNGATIDDKTQNTLTDTTNPETVKIINEHHKAQQENPTYQKSYLESAKEWVKSWIW